jgi:hypothetical protein
MFSIEGVAVFFISIVESIKSLGFPLNFSLDYSTKTLECRIGVKLKGYSNNLDVFFC